jgi:hypothetical protein
VRRLLRRTIEPLGVEIDVDLYEVVEGFHVPVRDGSLDEVIGWIEAGDVELDVMSPKHFLPNGWLNRARRLQYGVGGTGKDAHQLFVCGASGIETLGYAAGVADVAALNGSVFVECGTIRPDKLSTAMRAGQRLLIAPYHLGGTLVDPTQMTKLVCPEESALVQSRSGDTEAEERRLYYAALGCAQLGFMFHPLRELGEDPYVMDLWEDVRRTREGT